MFDSLTERLSGALRKISGKATLTENNIEEALREVRRALLEADVALPVVKDFIERVKLRAVGQEVSKSLSPGQAFIKIVQAELEAVMGVANEKLDLSAQPPAIVLMAGLQGAGKTTTVAKLARLLKNDQKKSVMVVSADVYRPAAIAQLETLAKEVGVKFFPSDISQKPEDIAQAAVKEARKAFVDVLLVDTAGRLAIDGEMMDEISRLHRTLNPIETLFVVDAMTGQDAAVTAKAFSDALPLTGVVLTKADGDSRGGAALSVRQVTGKPIKFIGMGEKIDALEPFYPDRIASRILGMGDLLSLIEEAERKVDRSKAEKLAGKFQKGKGFDLEDFREQLQQMKNMGGMASIMDKMPGMGALPPGAAAKVDEKQFSRMEAIINSMTPKERRNPDALNGSRKRRICQGSGTQIQDLNRLLKQHKQMQKMMKKMKSGALANMMRGLGGMRGPGGFPGAGGPPRF
ncbi:signal recognition particle protein [Pseudohongiella sp. SYSU M77423]|uniref:signal recognition particle protein n=1 Tax=unclassified Pseudohongiella TaxID=2629611 RepID=UPI000C9220F4|nr:MULTISPECIES: signal recognition particle protein [unclassified Pseudohongiella]MAY54499.1 signal recognition particle protein [Gammaproteobacteria bacterium]MDH7943501.1 signal recognition particle protein [Pseudohongiella sp. SYSU M77423]|tara:strand:+ start:86 stop:1468 length:1383 start_codon:yes stop_codon:yes gene_type:complete